MTPKQRMLAAYRGLTSDRPPVAPEFWYYWPAKVLGVGMVEFQREVPFWQALQTTFHKYGTEGWGAAFPAVSTPGVERRAAMRAIGGGRYRETVTTRFRGCAYSSSTLYDPVEPCWTERRPVEDPAALAAYLEMELSPGKGYDFSAPVDAHRRVGEAYLLELWLGVPFFDFLAAPIGFEKGVYWLLEAEPRRLEDLRERYIEDRADLVRRACMETGFESFVIGCTASCDSLLGHALWERWDLPYLRAMAEEIHRRGRLLHVHFHGRCRAALADFPRIGADCVCPFERPPGGDLEGREGLRTARRMLAERVSFNGNVHTVETLIRGTPEDVRREVREIKEEWAGSRRLLIGTGDQVGRETPEENVLVMVEEAKA